MPMLMSLTNAFDESAHARYTGTPSPMLDAIVVPVADTRSVCTPLRLRCCRPCRHVPSRRNCIAHATPPPPLAPVTHTHRAGTAPQRVCSLALHYDCVFPSAVARSTRSYLRSWRGSRLCRRCL
jgi:hypothetical protein